MARIWQLWRDRQRGESPEDQARRVAEERLFLAIDYRQVFGSQAGQRVLADILRRAGIMQTSFDAVPAIAAYNEGKRRIGLEIIELLNADPADQERLARTGDTESLFPPPPEDIP
jgi:hypothetical protein